MHVKVLTGPVIQTETKRLPGTSIRTGPYLDLNLRSLCLPGQGLWKTACRCAMWRWYLRNMWRKYHICHKIKGGGLQEHMWRSELSVFSLSSGRKELRLLLRWLSGTSRTLWRNFSTILSVRPGLPAPPPPTSRNRESHAAAAAHWLSQEEGEWADCEKFTLFVLLSHLHITAEQNLDLISSSQKSFFIIRTSPTLSDNKDQDWTCIQKVLLSRNWTAVDVLAVSFGCKCGHMRWAAVSGSVLVALSGWQRNTLGLVPRSPQSTAAGRSFRAAAASVTTPTSLPLWLQVPRPLCLLQLRSMTPPCPSVSRKRDPSD